MSSKRSIAKRLLWLFAGMFVLSAGSAVAVRQLLTDDADRRAEQPRLLTQLAGTETARDAFDRLDAALLLPVEESVHKGSGTVAAEWPAAISRSASGGRALAAQYRVRLAQSRVQMRQTIDSIHRTDPLLAGLLDRCDSAFADHFANTLALLAHGNLTGAATTLPLLRESLRRGTDALAAYSGFVREQAADVAADSLARSAERQRLADYIIALVTLAWIAVGIGLHLTILTPLRKTMQTVRALDEGVATALLHRRDEIGEIAHMLARLRETLGRLNRLAYSDPITRLPNRSRFDETVSDRIARARGNDPGFAVIFIDLNHFKSINDGFGYAFGDRYLTSVAERLRRATPESRLLCRYGGDKFAVLLNFDQRPDTNRLSQYTEASAVASGLLRTMAEPMQFEGHSLSPFVNIGVALYPHDGDSADTLLSAADAALHTAKHSRDGIRFASRGVIDQVRSTLLMAGDIRRGLDADEFRPYYQPIINIDTGAVIAAEALIRWVHPSEGLVLPDSFLGVAQNTGLFELITDVMLEKAFADAATWRRKGLDIKIAVNLSPHQLKPGIVERIRQQLARADLEPTAVDLEIVETAIMERPEEAAELLGQLRELGMHIGLDDFGTGYSSLSLLQRLPIDKIKIPHNFVGNIGKTREADEIVVATVALAQSLGYALVAEGVDNVEQMRRLRALRCPVQQGFLFSCALPLHEFEAWASSGEALLATRSGRAA